MRRSLVALVPITAALIISACVGERDTPASRLNAPSGALASGNPNACDFNSMTRDAKAYLSATDTVVSIA